MNKLAINKKTVPIINQIEKMVAHVPGWSPVDQLYTLFNLVYANPDLEGDIVEIGSWCGRTTSVLGMAARMITNTDIHCIDLFPSKNDWRENQDGTYSFDVAIGGQKYTAYDKQTVWREPFEKEIAPLYESHNNILDVFMETMKSNGLLDVVNVHRGTSDILKDVVPEAFKCKIAFIDGDHSYEAVCRDIRNVEPFLVDGGWICLDDAFSGYQGIDEAVTDLIVNSGTYELCQQMTRKLIIARKTKNK